jgi:hypothetical protein
MKKIESGITPYISLVLNWDDDQGNPQTSEYKLCFDYRCIKKAEDLLGIDLKDFQAWKKVTSAMTPTLVHAGMSRYHPDVTLAQVEERLNPDVQRALQDALFDALFPGVMDAVKKFQAEEAKKSEGTSPNEQPDLSAAV